MRCAWLLLALAACRPATDVGAPCVLVRANPDGGAPLPLTEAEVATPHDFVSFGAGDCEEFVCVRAASQRADAGPAAVAFGVCSRPCTAGSRCEANLACRPLILSTDALGGLDGGLPGARTSEFCAAD